MKLIESKMKEIEKRREVVFAKSNNSLAKKIASAQLESVDTKIKTKTEKVDEQIQYFQKELQRAEHQRDFDIQGIQTKFEKYREYCQQSIMRLETTRDTKTADLEKKKELIEAKLEKDEEDDAILIKLKVELRQLREQKEELNQKFLKQQEEEREALRQQQEAYRAEEERKFQEEERIRKEEVWKAYLERKAQEEEYERKKDERRRQELEKEKETLVNPVVKKKSSTVIPLSNIPKF